MMQQEKRKVSQPHVGSDGNGAQDESAAAGKSSQKIPRGPQQQSAGGGGAGGANNIFNSLQAFNSFVSGIGGKNDGGDDNATAAAGIGGDGANRAPLPFGASALTQLATKANRSQSASGPIGVKVEEGTASSPRMSRGSKLEAMGREFFSTREVASPTRSSYPANDSPSPGEVAQEQHPRSNSLPSSPPLNDDDVAKAYAAALSVSRLTDDEEFRLTHVGAATDDRQRRLLQRHRDEVAEREAAERVLNHQKFLRAQEEAAAKVGRSLQTHVKTLQGNWTKQREKLREGLKLPPLPGADRRGDAESDERNSQNDVAAKTSRGDEEVSVDGGDATVPSGVNKAPVVEKKDSSAPNMTQRSGEADCATKEIMTPGDSRISDDHGKEGVKANVASTSGSGSANLTTREEATQQQQNKSILGLPGMPFLTPGGNNGDGNNAPPPNSDGAISSANATGKRDAVTAEGSVPSTARATVVGGASSSSGDCKPHHDRYGRSNSAPTSPYNSFVGRKIGLSAVAGTRGGARAASSPPDDLKHIGTGVLRDRLVGDAVVGSGDSAAPDAAKVLPSQPMPTGRQSPPLPQAAAAVAAAAAASAAAATGSPAMCQTVWKRRDGLGKLSSNSWERRRLLLQDTKLIYFADDGESGGAGGSNSSLENFSSDKPAREPAVGDGVQLGGTNGRSAKEHQQERPQFKMPQNKWQGNWIWEQAAAAVATNFSSIAAAAGSGPDDHPSGLDTASSPRGCLDLVKEHASAAASLGTRQSGAPTPFALSIKVRGETKWKFCFDTHRDQLEWLTALSNVVVRHSMEVFVEEQASSREGVRVTCNLQGPFFSLHERPSGRSMSLDSNESLDILPAAASEVATSKSAATGGINASPRSSPNSGSCRFFPRGSKVDTARSLANIVLLILHYYSLPIRMFWVLFSCFNFFVWFVGKSENKISDFEKKKKKSVPKRGSSGSSTSAALPHVRDEKKPRILPVAGSSTARLRKEEIARSSGSNRIQWRNVVGSDLQVRSVGYDKTRKKMPSRGSLYECTAVDVFVSESRVEDICTKVQLPKVNGSSKEGTKRWHSPDVFVVSVAIPTEAPKLGWPTEDGLGFTIAAYFTMREDTRQILEMISEPGYHPPKTGSSNSIDPQKINAVRLFEEWCRRSPNDAQFLGRFKFIPGAVNVEEIGLPSYILKYNGKPVLIKRSGVTGILSSHPGVMEFDINLHAFPYLAKQAFSYMFENQFSKVVCNLAFVIEGRCDDELPEVILGAVQLCYPDPQHAVQGENFLNCS